MVLPLLLVLMLNSVQALNKRPIIGILTKPNNETAPTKLVFSGDYVSWLEQSGARVVPIWVDASHDEIRKQFSNLNGILFTGGGLSLAAHTQYYQTAQFIFNLAKEANDKGDHFPIWGTCMGFQLLSILAAQDHSVLLEYAYDSYNYPLALEMTADAKSSRIFGHAPQHVWDALTKQRMTQNLHHDGVLPQTYKSNKNLESIFDVISINHDKKGKPFASTIEGKKYPFYGTQWHPERNQFDWGIQEALNRSPEAIAAIQWVSAFFVQEAQKNDHHYPTEAQANSANVHNWPVTFTGGSTTDNYPEELTYYFPLKHQRHAKL